MKKFDGTDKLAEYIPYCGGAFIPKFHEGNRHQRRAEIMEIDRINPLIFEVEQCFIDAIFNNPANDYDYAYSQCLKIYNDTVEFIKNVKKPRWFKINENYFHDEFAPMDVLDERYEYREFSPDINSIIVG